MALVNKISSNQTELRYAEEDSPKVVSGDEVWKILEPNSYADFGATLALLARNPINRSRQRKKGVITDLDASGGINTDLTQANLQDIFQGLFFADLREKGAEVVIDVDGATEQYEVADTDGFFVGSLIFAAGHDNTDNDGLKRVTAITADVSATGVLTASANVADGDTVTIGTTVYTFETGTIDTAYEVLVGATASDSLDNLIAAVNGAAGEGTLYGTGTEANTFATAAAGAGDTVDFTAIASGAAGNSVATTEVSGTLSFGAATLTGGTNGQITVAENLVTETPTGDPTIVVVGFQFATADATIDATGVLPTLSTTVKDLTQLGLIPGEFVFLGGDLAASQFATAANNGFKRVLSIATNDLTFDKSDETLVTDAGAGKDIRIFIPSRCIKNEQGDDIVRRTYQLERALGAPDDSAPADIQYEYLTGSVLNTATFNIAPADKITVDLGFISMDQELYDSTEGEKAGTRPDLVEADAFNTSTDFSRIRLAVLDGTTEAPTPLFAFVTDLTLTVDNKVTPDKAVSVLGAFDLTEGTFEVGGSLTAYFADIASVEAVRDNSDVTLDLITAKQNAGIAIDVPLIALGNGRINVEQDRPVTVPLEMPAADGAGYHDNLNHTLMMCFFDYLPDAAE